MNTDTVIQLLRDSLTMALWLSAPLLIIGVVLGVVISLVQVVTSLQDSAVSAVPRLVALAVSCILLMPWLLTKLTTYCTALFGDFSRYAR